MDAALEALLRQTVTREPKTANAASGSYGGESYGAAEAGIQARVRRGRSRIRTPQGDEVVPAWEVILKGNQAIAVGDRLTVPAGTKHLVVKLHEPPDERGVIHHKRVWVT